MSRSHRPPSRKDRNHDEIASALRRVAIVIDTHANPEIGADLLVLSRGRVFFVEVKDGDKPPSARMLTRLEYKRRAECIAALVPYIIVRDVTEAMCALDVSPCSPGYVTSVVSVNGVAILPSVVVARSCGCGTVEGPARVRKRGKVA